MRPPSPIKPRNPRNPNTKDKTMSFKSLKIAFYTVALGCAALGMRGCSDEKNAQKTLEKMGYTDIKYEGHPWLMFNGSKGDMYCDEFSAFPPGGKEKIDVVVTKGIFKGATIRVK